MSMWMITHITQKERMVLTWLKMYSIMFSFLHQTQIDKIFSILEKDHWKKLEIKFSLTIFRSYPIMNLMKLSLALTLFILGFWRTMILHSFEYEGSICGWGKAYYIRLHIKMKMTCKNWLWCSLSSSSWFDLSL